MVQEADQALQARAAARIDADAVYMCLLYVQILNSNHLRRVQHCPTDFQCIHAKAIRVHCIVATHATITAPAQNGMAGHCALAQHLPSSIHR
jgi:hypothetical protein